MPNWKLAVAQHPMYLLIKEDELCAERLPPWGAPNIGAYIERLRANLETLRRLPQVKLGFEWSALELELLAEDAPEVFAEMVALARAGRIAFYNGTYSQPHLQTLSAEANYRQFEFGARVYRERCDYTVRTYAHQETSVHDQVPQLLRAFGVRHAVLPHFIATLVFDGGELAFHAREGLMFIQGSEFAGWRGLDGTVMDTFLRQPRHAPWKDWIDYQEVKGLLAVPTLLIEGPDLVAVDDAWLTARSGLEFVLLDEALPGRLRLAPARAQMRLYANWSYVEGIRAEELSRANWLAERAALRAEALGAMAFALLGRAPEPTQAIWKTILTTQHHDVYCFCAPNLKQKAIGWLRAAEQQAQKLSQRAAEALLARIRRLPGGDASIVVFSTTPHPVRAPVTIEAAPSLAVVLDADGQTIPCEAETIGPDHVRLTFIARSEGLGYAAYALAPGSPVFSETDLNTPLEFENAYYQARLEPDGTFSLLRPLPARRDVLASGKLRGNQLAGCDSQGLGTRHNGIDDVSRSRVPRQPAARGPELVWQPAAAHHRQTPLGVTLTVSGNLSPQARATTVIRMYQDLPWIEVLWMFDFDEASIGSFFDDETKLRIQWPVGFAGQIVHDIAFGHTASLPQRPFFPVSWVDVSDGTIGLAYFHQGTPKHWVKDGVLNNLLAWGEDTDAIGNRLDMGRWPKTFDQRLRGSHTFRAAVYPHAGDWRAADVVGIARSVGQRPVAFQQCDGAGDLPARQEVLALASAGLAATAVWADAEHVVCRCYSTGQPARGEARVKGLRPAGLYALSGAAVEQLGPFEIGHLRLAPDHPSGER